MTIEATVIADSVSEEGKRITTFLLRYPRFFHAELMTHRLFSRNASSSRAIPVKRILSDIRRDPATFSYWGANQKGMQASKELTGFRLKAVKGVWYAGMWFMTSSAAIAAKLGAHKQTVNRLTEPWAHINVVVTSTNYSNWFALRDHKDALPEIAILARKMRKGYNLSTPRLLKRNQWHLPFVEIDECFQRDVPQAVIDAVGLGNAQLCASIAVSVARCARTSYMTYDGSTSRLEEDFALFEKLVAGEPLHASPCEHQATPDFMKIIMVREAYMLGRAVKMKVWKQPELHGNFDGFIQYRKTLKNECIHDKPYDVLNKPYKEN